MSSYLETYSAAEEHHAGRIRLIKRISVAAVSAIIVGLILFGIFRNRSEEQQARTFLGFLNAKDYQAAYRMWGCTDTHPCPDYPLNKFMDDWGPKSTHADESSAQIGLSQSCGSGVLIRIDYKGPLEPVPLWVERDGKTISFAPWPECPGRHLHLGAWLRSLFH